MSDLNANASTPSSSNGAVPPRPTRFGAAVSQSTTAQAQQSPAGASSSASGASTSIDDQEAARRRIAALEEQARNAMQFATSLRWDVPSRGALEQARIDQENRPIWFVGEVSAYQRLQAQHGELGYKKEHDTFARAMGRTTLGLIGTAGLISLAFTVAPAAAALAAVVLFSSTLPMLAKGLRGESIEKQRKSLVSSAAKEATKDMSSAEAASLLIRGLESTTPNTFDGQVARVAFKARLAEMRAAGATAPLAVRNASLKHGIR